LTPAVQKLVWEERKRSWYGIHGLFKWLEDGGTKAGIF
jgi:hypothetical protein